MPRTDPDSGSVGFNKISKDSSGNNVRTFINATIYGKVKIESDDDSADEAYNYYVDRSAFREGDAIGKDDSNQRFIVGRNRFSGRRLLHQSGVCGIPSGRHTGSE